MAGLLGGVVDSLLGGNNSAQSYSDALAQFANITAPSVEDQQLALQNYQVTGQLTPEMEQALSLGDTSLAGVQTDPRLKADQMSALAQMAGIASGNPSAADNAGFELARQNSAANLQSQNAAATQNMAQRGQAGSGAELLAKLKNNQDQTQLLATNDMQQAQAMQQARMAALQNQSSMANSVRGQDYTEQSNLANARDAIAKYNASNSQNVQNANVSAANTAQAANVANQQNIANQNTSTQNSQQQYNKQLLQQQFNNQMGLAGAKSGIYQGQAQNENQQEANNAGFIGGLVGAGATMYASGGKSAAKSGDDTASDERVKTNIASGDNDIEDLLNKIKAYKFDYKNPAVHGQGHRTGVMAQDLEKSHAGANIVKDTPEGKMVDTKQASMLALAGVAHLNEKLNKILGKA